MDPLGVEPMEEPVAVSKTLLQNDDDLQFSITEALVDSGDVSLPQQDLLEKLPSQDNFSDIFGDSYISARTNDSLFSLDEADKDNSFPTFGHGDTSSIDNLEDAARNQGVSLNSSMFDDLLDFSTPADSEIDTILKDNMAKVKPFPHVDLLLGVDSDTETGPGMQPEVKVQNPDILEFVDISDDLAEGNEEAQGMAVADGLTCDSLSDGWSLVKEVSPKSPGVGELSPDIVVTSTDIHLDEVTDEGTKQEHREEKKDESFKEKDVEIVDNIKDGYSNQEIDFSVLELPESSNMNFDHFKHKRNISQKGSIANRKKPKRSTLQPNSEDSFFLDSTEPKPQKPEPEDEKESEKESESSSNHNQEDKSQDAESEAPVETSPSRKIAGGIKIPGLLEGLSKSKAFNKLGKASPETEPDIVPQFTSPEKDKSPTASQATISSPVADSPQFISPKPVILPRVLPKPSNKTLKETQNQTTAGGSVARASSFKITNQSTDIAEQPSLLKSSTALSRSASVKVTGTTMNKEKELSSLKEPTKPPLGLSKFSPPTIPELKTTLSPTGLKSPNKAPPPVASKPLVAAKPGRTNLKLSASFTGVRSPMLSENKAGSTSIPSNMSDKSLILNGNNKSEPITKSPEHKPKSDTPLITSNTRKPYSFGQKTVEVHSSATPYKANVSVDKKKSSSDETESTKQAVLTRVPSLKKTFESTSAAASPGAKPNGAPTDVETKKIEDDDIDDVFNTNSTAADKGVASTNHPDSSALPEKADNTNSVEDFIHHRKSSISGVMPVKSPLSSDKPPSGLMPRKGSITGSAYNPIGFRSTLGSSDSEQRSRGSSFSSTIDAAASADPLSVASAPSSKPKDDPEGNAEGRRSRDGSLNSTAADHVDSIPDKSQDSILDKPEIKPAPAAKLQYTPSFQRKEVDDTKKVAANEVKTDVQGSKVTPNLQRKVVDDTKKETASEIKTNVEVSKFTPSYQRKVVDTKKETGNEIKMDVEVSKFTPNFQRKVVDTKKETGNEVKTDAQGSKVTPSFQRKLFEDTKKEAANEVKTEVQGSKVTPSLQRNVADDTKKETVTTVKTDVGDLKNTPSLQRKEVDDTQKEAANEIKTDVREPLRTLRDSKSPFSRNGSPEITRAGLTPDKKSSPWNVQLKKVEKKEPVKPEVVIKTEDPPQWRQQLSMRSRNPPPVKDVEKPIQDNTPEWAKASIKRRQRLIDSGVIRSDS